MRNQQCNMVIADGLINMNINEAMESGRNWKLMHDVELLRRLEKFSENIICNAFSTLTSMDSLEDSLNETFLRVRTVANKFQAIADNQFIENRVQEEDEYVLANEKETGSVESRVSPETSKAQLLESIRECQNALSKKFETVQVSGIDSEDEMTNSSPVVLVPKNVYKERRLPHLIGGEQFIADETLGLMSYSENADNSNESEEDVDESYRSSYYSNSLKKSEDDQLGLHDKGETAVSSLSSSAVQRNLTGSTLRDLSSKASLEDQSEPGSEDDRLVWSSTSNVPVKCDVLPDDRCGLLNERGSELSPNCESTSEAENNKLDPTSDPKVEVTRDKLLAGRNFTSFKEDLARVLSNARTQSNIGSYKSVARFSDDDAEEEDESSPSPVNTPSLSTPDISSLPPTGSKKPALDSREADDGITGSVTLPAVSTNTLASLAKGRPRLKRNRRPPSRKHRQGGSLDADSPPSNLSNSLPSEDISNQGSSSAQHGSNILSPATDEEDLFVLPAYDLPTDPPIRGLLFNNTLLSPGATIDDGGLSTSPLFSSIPTLPNAKVKSQDQAVEIDSSVEPKPLQSSFRKSAGQVNPLENEVEIKTDVGNLTGPPLDLFSNSTVSSTVSEAQSVPRSLSKPTARDIEGPAESISDVFSSLRSSENAISSEDDDIFSSRSHVNAIKSRTSVTKKPDSPDPELFSQSNVTTKLSSSPLLFNDWSESNQDSKSSTKTKTLKSGLQWDILGSDDYGEDLFRSSKRESSPMSKPEEPKRIDTGLIDAGEKESDDIFSPAKFEKPKDVMFFEDDTFSSTDIFSNSSSFIGLSLPSNARDSLFASDDDDDDDSLFKTVKKYETGTAGTTKPSGTPEMKIKVTSTDSTSRELLKDPLMSMEDLE